MVYISVDKLVLDLVHATKKLKPYFQSHSIIVITDQPLKQILTKSKVSGRMTKWAIELAKHDISYKLRTAIKALVLADFITEGVVISQIEVNGLDKTRSA